ncbi:MAG TPA: hypothetical protein VMW58_04570 [Anaerolineae bacterium]|nr:hypothetical protein [Anaerolineae bacterium]
MSERCGLCGKKFEAGTCSVWRALSLDRIPRGLGRFNFICPGCVGHARHMPLVKHVGARFVYPTEADRAALALIYAQVTNPWETEERMLADDKHWAVPGLAPEDQAFLDGFEQLNPESATKEGGD